MDEMPDMLDPERRACLLWLIDYALSTAQLTRFLKEGYCTPLRNGDFSGFVSAERFSTRRGWVYRVWVWVGELLRLRRRQLLLTVRVRNNCESWDHSLLGEMKLVLRQDTEVLGGADFVVYADHRPAFASIPVSVKKLSELGGAWLYLTDEGRYCLEHTHCAGCGRVADEVILTPEQLEAEDGSDTDAELEITWSYELDAGPAGVQVVFCPGCSDSDSLDMPPGMRFYDEYGVPAHPWH